jgi:glutathione S-transferase
MKLYDWNIAPNPRRVRIFLAEKGIEVPTEEVGEGFELKKEYLEKNPHRTVPLLELDDGTLISEAPAICRYFETEHPEPPLMGRDAKERALVDMWERKAELEGGQGAGEVLRNGLPPYADRALAGYSVPIPQIEQLVERGKVRVAEFYKKMDERLGEATFLAGDNFSLADITALCVTDFATIIGLPVPDECANLKRWHAEVSARPSAAA